MKLYAPRYYKKFICIADKCEHSCCIGWEIDIDPTTFEKYQKLQNGYAPSILKSISLEGSRHFGLCEGDRCPHLDERGLCRIILNAGEDLLCNICREHPRFYNFTSVAEVGLGMSCREAARIILSSPDYDVMEQVGEVDCGEDEPSFDSLAARRALYGILRDRKTDYKTKLERICREYGIDTDDDGIRREQIDALEYLDESHKELFLHYSCRLRPDGADEYLERALAYFIYRHCTEAYDESDFCARLAFCLFCERLLASLICVKNAKDLHSISVIASIISEEIEYSEENTDALMY